MTHADYIRLRHARRDRIPGEVVQWQPSFLPNLVLWLDASKITDKSNGEAISIWKDQSPQQNNAVQYTGTLQPTYQTDVLNGMPAVRFDGTNDYLETINNMPGGSGSVYIHAVIKATNQTQRSIIGWGSQTTNNFMGFKLDTSKLYLSWWGNDIAPIFQSINTNEWYYVAAISSLAVNNWFYRELRWNGNYYSDNFNPTTTGKNTASTKAKIGRAANNPWSGDIAEICVFEGFMPLGAYDPSGYANEVYEPNIDKLERYFRIKYGLP